jgi:hypothetical protein
MKLREIVHARTGDSGNNSIITIIAYKEEDFPLLSKNLTAEKVKSYFSGFVNGPVERYELPDLWALNFVLHEALAGGIARSLLLDIHGKTLSSALLDIEITG